MSNPRQKRNDRAVVLPVILAFLAVTILPVGCARLGPSEKVQTPPGETSKGYIRLPNNPQNKYYGFNIYRGETRTGAFTKINTEIIPSQSPDASGKPSIFIDEGLQKGKEYYYYIEGITFAGKTERVTPAFRVVPQ